MSRLNYSTTLLNNSYKSAVNPYTSNCRYKIIKKNKTTCWVKLIENNKETDTIYKGVRYSVLKN